MDMEKWNIDFFLKNSVDCLNYLKENYNSIPYMNVNSPEYINNSLVRFRGMIQDMYDPEYYLENCEVLNTATKASYTKIGKYTDVIRCDDNEVLDTENPNNVTGERQTYVVISVPALNTWVNEIETAKYSLKNTYSVCTSSSCKRPLDMSEDASTSIKMNTNQNKKLHNTEPISSNTILTKEALLNFPISDKTGVTCQVKIYEQNNIKLNEIYDFIGFLSNDILPVHTQDIEFNNDMELETHNPPLSLISRIHCISWNKVEYINPLLETINMDYMKIKYLKQELQLVLTELMLGDDLAANYLLYHLLSKVYLRKELIPHGSFTLNISNIPVGVIENYGEKIYSIIETIVEKSHYLPMTLENMNSLAFTPKKDYVCNRLTSGLLQLSSGTHLVLDETKLSSGRLNECGVKAVSTINNIIKCQKVAYDFSYYTIEFDCDLPILVISEGKSLLPSDKHIILKPQDIHVNTFDDIYKAINKLLNPDLLNSLRVYLTTARNQEYNISEDMLETIQKDFVNLRQLDTKTNADDLHQLLVLSKYVCIADGKSKLDEEGWKTACYLENSRKARF